MMNMGGGGKPLGLAGINHKSVPVLRKGHLWISTQVNLKFSHQQRRSRGGGTGGIYKMVCRAAILYNA